MVKKSRKNEEEAPKVVSEEKSKPRVEVKPVFPDPLPAPPCAPKIPLNVYFSVRKIKQHWQPGMNAYKNASEEGAKSKEEWDKFFEGY